MHILLGLVGLFFILRELIPLMNARRTGVIHTRGHSRKRVERAVEPERFEGLCRKRHEGIKLGLVVIGLGVVWFLIGFWALIPALIVSLWAAARARKPRPKPVADEFS